MLTKLIYQNIVDCKRKFWNSHAMLVFIPLKKIACAYANDFYLIYDKFLKQTYVSQKKIFNVLRKM